MEEPNKLHQSIETFIDNLDALMEALLPVMVIVNEMRKHYSDGYLKTLERVGSLVSDDGNRKEFNIPLINSREVFRNKKKCKRAASAVEILPRTFLVSFVSEFDTFLGSLIKEIFCIKPEILNGSEKNLTYKNLIKFNSLDAARDFIIENEVESVLRESHSEQFSWLERKLNMTLRKDLNVWDDFVELTERRNLFVHCGGVISSQYLKVCGDNNLLKEGFSLGTKLGANRNYLTNSYKCLYEIGVKLTQVLWRKLKPDELEQADISLNYFAYELLVAKKYDLAIRLLEFANALPRHSSEMYRRMFIINLAQAYKFSDKEGECNKRLLQEDWSACNDVFAMCVSVLQDDFDRASMLMNRLGKSSEITELGYLEWPIFRNFRESPQFKKAFFEIFEHEPQNLEQYKKLSVDADDKYEIKDKKTKEVVNDHQVTELKAG